MTLVNEEMLSKPFDVKDVDNISLIYGDRFLSPEDRNDDSAINH